MVEYDKSFGRFQAKSNRGIVELEIDINGFGTQIIVYEEGIKFPKWFYDSCQSDCEMDEDDSSLTIYGDLGYIEIEKPFIKRVNTKVLEKAKQYVQNNKEYELVSLGKSAFEAKLKKETFNQTEISLDFDFKPSCNGELKLYIKEHDFTLEEVKKLIELEWLFEDVLEEWEPGSSPFQADYELFDASFLFNFMIRKAFNEKAYVIALDDESNNIKVHIITLGQ